MGAVSIVSSSFYWLHNMDTNCACRSFLYQDFVNNYTDVDDIPGDIPHGWWLQPPSKGDKAVKQSHYLLAVLVHKNNADIVSDPLDAAAGANRET